MNLIYKVKKFITNPEARFYWLHFKLNFYSHLSDEAFVKKEYQSYMNEELDLINPVTFNEKLQWLKLYNHNPQYTIMVDKNLAKEYVSSIIGNQYIIPTYGVWKHFEDIDFDQLPNQFVLKCNHNSGGLIICKDKNKLDYKNARKVINKAMKTNFYKVGREWPYKNVTPVILAEKYMTDSDTSEELTDYKLFCFDGKVDCIMLCIGRSTGIPQFYFFDKNWNIMPEYNIPEQQPCKNFEYPKPAKLNEMIQIAEKLSSNIPHLRVDLYSCNGSIYFGELTFFSGNGLDKEISEYANNHWGDLIKLPSVIIK